jgi:hypothetical protein
MNVSQNNDDVVNASVLGDLAANGQDAAGSSMPSIDLGVDGQSMVDQAPSEGSSLDSSNDSGGELDVTPGSGSAIEDSEENQGDQRPGEQAGDALMGDQDPGLMQEGKRVKVSQILCYGPTSLWQIRRGIGLIVTRCLRCTSSAIPPGMTEAQAIAKESTTILEI